jgi:2-dehydro-3-deoxyphosphogalactonate aldolase
MPMYVSTPVSGGPVPGLVSCFSHDTDAGADGLKLFPAETMPPAAVKAWRAVLPPETLLLPVGGITPERMADYLAAGANGFGLGSALFAPTMAPEMVRERAQAFVAALGR